MSQTRIYKEAQELWRLIRVQKCVPLSKATIYRLIAQGEFPKPIKLTNRSSAWDSFEVISWIDSRRMEDQI